MRKFYKLISYSILTALYSPVTAQQLPNAGFEDGWQDCYPWTSNKNSNGPFDGDTNQGKTPKPWCISNTIGTGSAGKTTVGENVNGHLSSSAIKLTNIDSGIGDNIIPGYVSLGTTWSTSTVVSFTKPLNKDGGTFGGISFTNKPDALSLWYTRVESSDNSSIIAYLWKGTYTQQDVPGNITFSISSTPSQPKLWTMIDRDRNILDIATEKGEDITTKGTLIASINAPISTVANEWTEFFHEFEYKNNDTPEKINVIISAGDYFNSTVVANSSITVDDVKLIYYSRLKSLKYNDAAVEFTDGGTKVSGTIPTTLDGFNYELLGQSAKAAIGLDPSNDKATIKVSNVDADKDGLKEHTYTVNFDPIQATGDATKFVGKVIIKMGGSAINGEEGTNAEVQTIPTNEDEYMFKLPDFSLDLGDGPQSLGDIVVPYVKASTVARSASATTYTGKIQNMSLAEGEILADVDLNGTTDADGNANMNIGVKWHAGETPEDDLPIEVSFVGKDPTPTGIGSIDADNADAPIEYFNMQGMRVDTPENGLYIRRQGNTVTKVLVK